jgi:hypothetical protein
MTPADSFSWGSTSTNRSDGWRSMQIDHNTPWTPDVPGLSTIGNYGPLTQFHHNLKTHAGWQVQQPFPGIYLWRDPHAAITSSTTPAPAPPRVTPAEEAPAPAELRARGQPFAYDRRVTTLRLQNESPSMLCVFVEPLGEDLWIAPAQTLTFTGTSSEAEVDCIWHLQGVTVWMSDTDAYGFVVTTQAGKVVDCGYQRPPGAFDPKP